jgi:hypothetical protein
MLKRSKIVHTKESKSKIVSVQSYFLLFVGVLNTILGPSCCEATSGGLGGAGGAGGAGGPGGGGPGGGGPGGGGPWCRPKFLALRLSMKCPRSSCGSTAYCLMSVVSQRTL